MWISMFALSACILYDNGRGLECGEPLSVRNGEACTCDRECLTGLCLEETLSGVPGGICFAACKVDEDCGLGGTCRFGVCRVACLEPGECSEGRICALGTDDEVGGCVAFCDADSECRSRQCDRYTGDCIQPDDPAPDDSQGGVAAPCTSEDTCRSGVCVDDGCLVGCSVADQGCPEDAVCIALPGDDFGYCTFECRRDARCEDLGWSECLELSDVEGSYCD